MLMFIIGMSLLFSYVMSYLHISQSLAQWIVAPALSRWVLLAAILALVIVLGFFLPPVSIILMTAPIILPPLQRRGLRPGLVRRADDDRDGGRADPSAGGPEHLRDQEHRARHPARRTSSAACCPSWR